MKKSTKIFLGVAGVLALIGICFLCLSIYAKKEINKPKFEFPETAQTEAEFNLPATKEEAYDFVSPLYEYSSSADDVEGTWKTEVHTGGDKVTPFSDADNAVLSRVLEKSQEALGELYPKGEKVLMNKAENAPVLGFTKADVTDFKATLGKENEAGETEEDGNCYITLTLNPESIDTASMAESEIRKNIEKELSSVLTVSSLEIIPAEYSATFVINCTSGLLTKAEIKRKVTVKTAVDFTGDYTALSSETAQLELPWETVENIEFFRYGITFTEKQTAVKKDDVQALPLEVRVNEEATKDDYKLTFEFSEDGILEIDEDGVLTVVDTREEPIVVTATLEYGGHTYTDTLNVYATELEVTEDEPADNG